MRSEEHHQPVLLADDWFPGSGQCHSLSWGLKYRGLASGIASDEEIKIATLMGLGDMFAKSC